MNCCYTTEVLQPGIVDYSEHLFNCSHNTAFLPFFISMGLLKRCSQWNVSIIPCCLPLCPNACDCCLVQLTSLSKSLKTQGESRKVVQMVFSNCWNGSHMGNTLPKFSTLTVSRTLCWNDLSIWFQSTLTLKILYGKQPFRNGCLYKLAESLAAQIKVIAIWCFNNPAHKGQNPTG